MIGEKMTGERAKDIRTVLSSSAARLAIEGERAEWAWRVIGELLDERAKLVVALRAARDYIAGVEGVHDDGTLAHRCELQTNPESGRCSTCEMWGDVTDALATV